MICCSCYSWHVLLSFGVFFIVSQFEDWYQVKLAESTEQMGALHKRLIGPREGFESIARSHAVIQASHTGRQSIALVRTTLPITDPAWQIKDVSLEDIVLAYLASQEHSHPQLRPIHLMKEVLL